MRDSKYLKYLPEFIRHDSLFLVSFVLSIIINIIIWIILLIKFGFSADPSPLHFSVVYGINYVGPAYEAYQIPLVGLAIFFLNWFLAKMSYREFRLVSYFVLLTSSFAQFILFLVALSLVILNR